MLGAFPAKASNDSMQQLSLDVHLVQPPSFENFVAGPNLELMAQLRAIVAGDRPSKCLFIWGEPGSGKSHIIEALRQIRAVVLGASNIELLDDCQNLSAESQIGWFSTFISQASDSQAMVIACADQAPKHLDLRPDLRTRLGSGLIFQLKRLNDEQKTEALRQHAASRQIGLPEELLRYLLRHYPRDIRSLILILDSLDRYAFQHKRALSLPLLRDMESQPASPAAAERDETEAKTAPNKPD
jgi:DnaA-homolog protein